MTELTSPHRQRLAAHREDIRLRTLRSLAEDPNRTQRSLSRELGVSLGATNNLLNGLIENGYVNIRDSQTAPGKVRYTYALSPAGVAEQARLATGYLQRRRAEYAALQLEIERLETESGPTANTHSS